MRENRQKNQQEPRHQARRARESAGQEARKEADKRAQTAPPRPLRLAILFSGSGSNLENLVSKQADIAKSLRPYHIAPHFVLAISNEPDALGIARCARLGLKCLVVAHRDFPSRAAFEEELCARLREEGIDLVVLAGFMRILGEGFTRSFLAINIHPSFLPLYKGAHAIEQSFSGGEDFGGVSVHWVSGELDSGELILQEKLPKIPNESLESFTSRIHALEHRLYPRALAIALIQQYARQAERESPLLDSPRLDSLESPRTKSPLASKPLESPSIESPSSARDSKAMSALDSHLTHKQEG